MNEKVFNAIMRFLSKQKPIRGMTFTFDGVISSDGKPHFVVVVDLPEDKNWTSWMLTGTAEEMINKAGRFITGNNEFNVATDYIVVSVMTTSGIKIKPARSIYITDNVKYEIFKGLQKKLKNFEYISDKYAITYGCVITDIEYTEEYDQIGVNIEINVDSIKIANLDGDILTLTDENIDDIDNNNLVIEFIENTVDILYDMGDSGEIFRIVANEKISYDFMLDMSDQYIVINLLAESILGFETSGNTDFDPNEYDEQITEIIELIGSSGVDDSLD